MQKKILACSLAAALAACGLTATQAFAVDTAAAGNAPAAVPAHGRPLQRIFQQLNLTGDQRIQIKAVFADEKDTLRPLVSALREARQDLRAAIRADDANEAAVRAASAKVAAAEADLAVERMKIYGKIATILTGAQRQQLASLQQRADRAGWRRAPGLDH
jgi:Spy/CpxP family protein refolding chaperone